VIARRKWEIFGLTTMVAKKQKRIKDLRLKIACLTSSLNVPLSIMMKRDLRNAPNILMMMNRRLIIVWEISAPSAVTKKEASCQNLKDIVANKNANIIISQPFQKLHHGFLALSLSNGISRPTLVIVMKNMMRVSKIPSVRLECVSYAVCIAMTFSLLLWTMNQLLNAMLLALK